MAIDDVPRPDVKVVKPHQLGWLRRPDLEESRHHPEQVWEKPNGELYVHHGRAPLVLPVLPKPVIQRKPYK